MFTCAPCCLPLSYSIHVFTAFVSKQNNWTPEQLNISALCHSGTLAGVAFEHRGLVSWPRCLSPKIHCDMETNLANLTTESQKSTLHLFSTKICTCWECPYMAEDCFGWLSKTSQFRPSFSWCFFVFTFLESAEVDQEAHGLGRISACCCFGVGCLCSTGRWDQDIGCLGGWCAILFCVMLNLLRKLLARLKKYEQIYLE